MPLGILSPKLLTTIQQIMCLFNNIHVPRYRTGSCGSMCDGKTVLLAEPIYIMNNEFDEIDQGSLQLTQNKGLNDTQHRLNSMCYKIIIKELRSVKYLEFDVPTSGVHVLTGCNGCGKTSLLITLNRICNNTAFSSLKFGRKVGMDKFSSTRITYTNGTSDITYKRTNRGWEPTPSKASSSPQ